MKEYIKPEVEVIDFATESIAEQGTVSGPGWGNLDGSNDQ